jgi:hypothetical protein
MKEQMARGGEPAHLETERATASAVTPSPNVYQCIAAVSGEIAKTGIAKDRKNAQQGYSFRGIDEVFNALAPLLAKHHLVILPRILSRECVERTSKSGSAQFFVIVEAEFDYVSAADGSKHTVRTFGEAQDSADKATNKAMSAAYKYAAFQTFCIPTEGDNDADAVTPEPTKATVPDGFEDWLIDLEAVAAEGTEALKAAWKKSQPYMRKFLTDTHNAKWEALKAKADKVQVAA